MAGALLAACGTTWAGPEDGVARLIRFPAPSPDGKVIAFSYAGDIWTVPSAGGEARVLTMHEAHDVHPVWSPDGRTIVFGSNRNGDYDLYSVPAEGGRPTRLTWSSGTDLPCDFAPDGKSVLFRSTRAPSFPGGADLYTVPLTGGTPRQVTKAGASFGVYSPDGSRIVYVRGYGSASRRGYRGSANNELWLCNADGSNNRRLTDFAGDDAAPAFAPDGRTLYFVSDRHGTRNLWKLEVPSPGDTSAAVPAASAVTYHLTDEVRRARIARNGSLITYEFAGALWAHEPATGRTREVAVTARPDDKANPVRKMTFTGGATEMELSPDQRQVALVIRGEIFVMDAGGGAANRVTDVPALDHDVVWSQDGKKLYFVSDRDGVEQLWSVESADPKRPDLARARNVKAVKLSTGNETENSPILSPDGKKLLCLRGDEHLWVLDLAGKDAPRRLVEGPGLTSVSWSPDSKWIAYTKSDEDWGSDVFVTTVGGGKTVNVTRWGIDHAGVQWTADGKFLVYASRRSSYWGIYMTQLQRPLAEGEADRRDGTVQIDFDDLHRRWRQVVGLPGDVRTFTLATSFGGRSIALAANSGGSTDIWIGTLDGGRLNRVATGVSPRRMFWNKLGDRVWILDGNGQIRHAMIGGIALPGRAPAAGTTEGPLTLGFTAEMDVDTVAETKQVFTEAWRTLSEKFYDPGMHGADWPAARLKYGALLPHVRGPEDFGLLMDEMLGELNASHLGFTPAGRGGGETSGHLGMEFDPAHAGPGLKIASVMQGGPCDRRGLDIKAGDILFAVNGKPVGPEGDFDRLMLGTAGKTVWLKVGRKPDPAAAVEVDVRPVDGRILDLLSYDAWVAKNASVVDFLSGGKVGYVHIRGMDDPSLDRLRRELFSDMRGKSALVVDVRFNGGGFTHDSVLDLLDGRIHTNFIQRGGRTGSVMRNFNRKWSGPAVVMINERSASDAEIFPHGFRSQGLGKLVGRPTMGAVIGTYNVTLMDGSGFRIPRTGVFTAEDGRNMENTGVRPDIELDNHPDDLAKGKDAQLAAAVKSLLDQLDRKTTPGESTPTRPGTTTATGPATVTEPRTK